MRLGTGVLLPALRSPVVLPQIVATLDRIAEGRVILGVGIAADTPAIRKEFAAAGVPWDRRVGRYLETLEICRALWSRDGVSFSGKHFTLENITKEPKPHRPGGPPNWIGGSGPSALRDAAKFGAWFPPSFGSLRLPLRRTLVRHLRERDPFDGPGLGAAIDFGLIGRKKIAVLA